MKLHTNDFKEQIKTLGKEIEVKISYGDTVLGVDNLNAVNLSYQGAILKSVMKQLDVDSNIDIPLGTVFKCEFGLKVNGEYEYIDLGNYIVKSSEKQEDTGSYKIVCYDKLLISMHEYSRLPITYPISVRDYINSLCLVFGIEFKNKNEIFANYEKLIKSDLYDGLGYTFRDILDELAQVTASTICINNNDELEVRYINNTFDEIDEEFLKDVNVNFGEKYGPINSVVLSRSGESDNIYLRDENSVNENGLCEIKIVDNQIMNFNDRDQYLGDILNKLNGLEYYLNDYSSTGIIYYDVCDRYGVEVGDNVYSCVMFNDEINITQGIVENVFTEMPEETQTDYTKADKTDRRINQTYIIVDKQNQLIEQVVSQTDEQNQKIAKVTQTVDELNSKISDIADITISAEDSHGTVELDSINQSEPIRVVIRPIGESISYLYPHNNLFLSDTLFSKNRKIRFINENTEETFDYELPDNLFYYDSENYDEFLLDYDGQSCVINKKVGYNADGTTYVLDTPTTLEFEYPRILLTDGDYTISVLGYDNAYLFVRMMAQNIYTTQFATKAELNSEITQTANSIISEVTGKIDTIDDELSAKLELKVDTNKLISEINASADVINLTSNRLIIDSNNFKLTADGKITSTSGKIGGYDIGATNLSAKVGKKLSFPLDNQTDFQTAYNKIYNHVYNIELLTGNELKKYDINEDGIIDKIDLLMLNRIYYGYAIIEGNFSINSGEYENILSFKDLNGNVTTGIDLDSITTPYLSAKSTFSCPGSATIDTLEITGTFTNNSDKRLKKDIKELNNEYINIVKNTRPVEFTYKKDNTRHIGFIAQELEKSFKESKIKEIPIKKDELGIYSIDYISLIGILWKSNQDLYKRIESLEKLLKESEN